MDVCIDGKVEAVTGGATRRRYVRQKLEREGGGGEREVAVVGAKFSARSTTQSVASGACEQLVPCLLSSA